MSGTGEESFRLRLILEVHDLEQRDVARAAGVSPSLVAHWVAGRRRPSPQAQAAIGALIASRPLLGSRS